MRYTLLFLFGLMTTLHDPHAQSKQPIAGKIYRSADQGASWQQADAGFPAAVVNDFAFHNGNYFAATDAHGLYISKDHLQTWKKTGTGLPADIKIDAVEGMGKVLMLGSHQYGIYISVDDGATWKASNDGLTNHTVRRLCVNGSSMLAGTNDGVFISTNNGKTWKQAVTGKQVNGITVLNGKIYAGTNKGILLTVDNGANWRSIYDAHPLHNISNDGEYMFALCYGPTLIKTKDDGAHWIKSDAGLPNLYTFHVQRIGKRLIACQWDGMYKSDNNGSSWEKSSNGLPLNMAFKELLITNDGIVIAGP